MDIPPPLSRPPAGAGPAPALRRLWPDSNWSVRRAVLAGCAGRAQSGWRAGHDLRDWPLDQLLADPPPVFRPRPARVAELEAALAGWYGELRDRLPLRDAAWFIRCLLRADSVSTASVRPMVGAIHAEHAARQRARARALYRWNLECIHPPPGSAARAEGIGCWRPDPGMSADALGRALRSAEASPDTVWIKRGPAIAVLRAELFGRKALVKRYQIRSLTQRLKGRFRPSRGRRAWAAAQTLRALGVATPAPLGFLEVSAAGPMPTSYFISEFIEEAGPARRWIEEDYRRLPDAERVRFRALWLKEMLRLYELGVYHADTKTSNVLLAHPSDPARRALLWIDLECLSFGRPLTRRRVFRNLVQLNGSLGPHFPDADRLDFLRHFARTFPWANRRWTIRRIALKTGWRLTKEKLGWAGP
jgi:hypothetical protein